MWFFAAYELSQFNILVADVFFADGKQADTGGGVKPNGTGRITTQLTSKDRLALSYNNSRSFTQRYDFSSTTSPEAGLVVRSPINYVAVAKWTRTATSRLLVEVGQSVAASSYFWEYQPEVGPFDVANVNLSTGRITTASATAPVRNINHSYNTVGNVSYVTGSHALKAGVNFTSGRGSTEVKANGDMQRINFINVGGVTSANSVVVRNSPVLGREDLNAELGIYLQDKWSINRLTVTPGVRFDYLNASVPDQTAPAGRFVPAREADAISCLPCWSDWAIRLGAAYDLFGNGRTAIKASVGKYMASQTLGLAESVNPIRSRTETRTWTDLDGNGTPLDSAGNVQPGEVGPSPVGNFGVPAGATVLDEGTPRPTNWEETVSVVHEVRSGLAVTAGFYRRHFQNLSITRNLAVDPFEDYTPFTLNGPTDPDLPGGGGEQIVMYNLNRDKVGVPAENVSTFSDRNTRVYNGFEVSVNARLRSNGFVLGGITTERTATNNCDVNNPNTVPWDIQLSGSVQAIPGGDISANYSFNSAVAGVTLNGVNNLSVNLVEPDTQFYDYQTQADVRLARSFRVGSNKRLQAYMDVFNILNASTVVSVNNTFGQNWLRPLVVMQARRFQFGARLDF
jgi:hypothetical protein